jgi:hypothetical protein
MGRIVRAVKRVTVLLAIWAAAASLCFHTTQEYLQLRALKAEVAQLEQERQLLSGQLTRTLVEENELRTNPERQVEVLQRDFGFSLRDETPILIVPAETQQD